MINRSSNATIAILRGIALVAMTMTSLASVHASCSQFYSGYCTYYAAQKFDQVAPYPQCNWGGNANQWLTNASATGWQTTTSASAAVHGAVVVWYGGGYGHVAFVESTTANGINISEMNWGWIVDSANGITTNFNKVTTAYLPYSSGLNRGSYSFAGFILPYRVNAPPAGYTACASEHYGLCFNIPVDLAYGASGRYNYRYDASGNVTFDNATFGDPIPGVVKSGYYRPYTYCGSEGSTYTFNQPVEVAYGIGGRFAFVKGVAGTVRFSNAVFGDPAPGWVKSGYFMPYTKCANENQSYTFYSPTDIAYGAFGHYYFYYRVTGTVTFGNGTFGDPIPGIVKAGYFRPSH